MNLLGIIIEDDGKNIAVESLQIVLDVKENWLHSQCAKSCCDLEGKLNYLCYFVKFIITFNFQGMIACLEILRIISKYFFSDRRSVFCMVFHDPQFFKKPPKYFVMTPRRQKYSTNLFKKIIH